MNVQITEMFFELPLLTAKKKFSCILIHKVEGSVRSIKLLGFS